MLLYRVQDVGKSKAEVAAKRVMERVSGVNIVPHFCRIEDKELEFYSQFHIIVLGLDSIEARSYINSVACGFLGMFSMQPFGSCSMTWKNSLNTRLQPWIYIISLFLVSIVDVG